MIFSKYCSPLAIKKNWLMSYIWLSTPDLRTSKTNSKRYTYLFNHIVNEDETTLANFRYEKKKTIKIIKPIKTNPVLLTPSLRDQQQSAKKKKENTNTNSRNISSTNLIKRFSLIFF